MHVACQAKGDLWGFEGLKVFKELTVCVMYTIWGCGVFVEN